MYMVAEKAGKRLYRAARTPLFETLAQCNAYIAECPNAFAWGWTAKRTGK